MHSLHECTARSPSGCPPASMSPTSTPPRTIFAVMPPAQALFAPRVRVQEWTGSAPTRSRWTSSKDVHEQPGGEEGGGALSSATHEHELVHQRRAGVGLRVGGSRVVWGGRMPSQHAPQTPLPWAGMGPGPDPQPHTLTPPSPTPNPRPSVRSAARHAI